MRGAYPLTDAADVAAASRELHRGEEDAAEPLHNPADSGASSLADTMFCHCGHGLGWHDHWGRCWQCICSNFTLSPMEEIA